MSRVLANTSRRCAVSHSTGFIATGGICWTPSCKKFSGDAHETNRRWDPLPQKFERPMCVARFPGRLRQDHGAVVERAALAFGERLERGVGLGDLVTLSSGLSSRGDRAFFAHERCITLHGQPRLGLHGPLISEIDSRGPRVREPKNHGPNPDRRTVSLVELAEAIAECRRTSLDSVSFEKSLDVTSQAAGGLVAAVSVLLEAGPRSSGGRAAPPRRPGRTAPAARAATAGPGRNTR